MLAVHIHHSTSRDGANQVPVRQEDAIPPICRRLMHLADRNPRRATACAQRVLQHLQTNDPILQAWATYTLGWALLCWERPDAARAYLADAHSAFQAQGAWFGVLRCRHAELLADMLQLTRADLGSDFVALTTTYLQHGAPAEAAQAQLDHARLLIALGRSHDAAALLEAVAPLVGELSPLEHTRLQFLQGIVANLLSEYSRATELLGQAEQGFARLRHRPERIRCWFYQAWVLLRQERLDEALALYRRAEEQFGCLDLPLDLALCAKNIGWALMIRGAYDQALLATLTALAGFIRLKRQSDIGGCQLHLGNIYVYTGCWEAALACYRRAETIYVTTGLIGLQLIVRRNQAMVYREQKRYSDAQELLAVVEGQAWALGNRAEVAEIWCLQATLLADQHLIDEALQRYHQAQDLFMQLRTIPGAAECQLERGWLFLRQGAVAQAQTEFAAAAPLLQQHPHPQLHTDAIQLATASGAVLLLLELHEGARALVLQHELAAHLRFQGDDEQVEPTILPHELSDQLLQDPGQPEAYAEFQTMLATSTRLVQSMHRQAQIWNAEQPSPLEATFDYQLMREQLNAAYGDEWTTLVYILNGDMLVITALTPQGVTLEQTPYDAAFQRLVTRAIQPMYRDLTYRDFPYLQGQTLRSWETLRLLADRLIPAAVSARLHPAHRLLVVPAGPLHLIPWALLRIQTGWLAEGAIIQLIPSLTIYQLLAARQQNSTNTALLIGCSTFDTLAMALPAVREELCMVAERWPGTSVLLQDAQATRGALLQRSRDGELRNYGLIHLASHAWLMPTQGHAAHIKLSDGNLALLEIAGLRLNGALVILSACDGAAADILQGEEILSLSWALLAAGASAVLASFFALEDSAVIRFMGVFYDTLRQHQDAASALAFAQRALTGGYPEGVPEDPRLWGSFVLIGERRFSW
jgi:CHAT domain-containing protein/tetratricopeptide (TPR) repeat protein